MPSKSSRKFNNLYTHQHLYQTPFQIGNNNVPHSFYLGGGTFSYPPQTLMREEPPIILPPINQHSGAKYYATKYTSKLTSGKMFKQLL